MANVYEEPPKKKYVTLVISHFAGALFYVWRNLFTKFRALRNNVLKAFKIIRFCFFDLRGDLGALKVRGVADFAILTEKTNKKRIVDPRTFSLDF